MTQEEILHAEALKREAIAFAKWILKKGFVRYEDGDTIWWGMPRADKDYMTEELYDLWKEEQPCQMELEKRKGFTI